MKTIKGKVDILVFPLGSDGLTTNRRDDMTIRSLYYQMPWFYLSKATEEQASLLVDSFIFSDEKSGKYTAFKDYLDEYGFVMTAKESLFSLLKANGCLIKDWFDGTTVAHDTDEAYKWQQAPDDYLLIIKQ